MSKTALLSVDPRTLKPNPWNTNVVSAENEAKIDASVSRLGMFKPIIVRQLASGELEILGGAHRRDSAIRLGIAEVPVMNVGVISDQKAKEIGLVDNGRYGNDDTVRLAALLDELGTPEDMAAFMPYTLHDFESIFASSSIALDDLDLPDELGAAPASSSTKATQTHTIMRFKIPLDDEGAISAKIKAVMKQQRFNDEDSLTNAGNALVHILNQIEV